MLEQLGAVDISIWSSNGKLLANARQTGLQLAPPSPVPVSLRRAQRARGFRVEGLEDATVSNLDNVRIKVLVPIFFSTAWG